MPIQVQPISTEQLAELFARRPRGPENVGDYVDVLKSAKIEVGQGLTLKTQIVTPDEGDSYTILAGSVDNDDPAGVSVRAAKRRFGIAARQLGYSLDWRELDGWLVLKAVELKPDNGKDD